MSEQMPKPSELAPNEEELTRLREEALRELAGSLSENATDKELEAAVLAANRARQQK